MHANSGPGPDYRKRNWRFRFDTSMRSRSITSIFPKPESAKSFRISHPAKMYHNTRTGKLGLSEALSVLGRGE